MTVFRRWTRCVPRGHRSRASAAGHPPSTTPSPVVVAGLAAAFGGGLTRLAAGSHVWMDTAYDRCAPVLHRGGALAIHVGRRLAWKEAWRVATSASGRRT